MKEKIIAILDNHFNNYWHTTSDRTKELIADEIIEASPPNDSTATCKWVELLNEYEQNDGYNTSCDSYFIDKYDYKYCPDCGGKIEIVLSRTEV